LLAGFVKDKEHLQFASATIAPAGRARRTTGGSFSKLTHHLSVFHRLISLFTGPSVSLRLLGSFYPLLIAPPSARFLIVSNENQRREVPPHI